jgi:hypothetical protein
MPTTSDDAGVQWDRVAEELRTCREAQRQAWGDIDNATLGRYLAGEAGSDEQQAVEAALADHPELRVLTDLVREVLADAEPLPAPAPQPAAVLEPVILSLPAGRPGRKSSPAFRQRAALAAAACVLVGLGLALAGPSLWVHSAREGALAVRDAQAAREALALARADQERSEIQAGIADNLGAVEQVHRLNQVALSLQNRGELTRAEPFFHNANRISRRTLGAAHPATRETVRNLAQLYQTALVQGNKDLSPAGDDPGWKPASGLDSPIRPVSLPAKRPEPEVIPPPPQPEDTARAAAQELRERLVNCPPEEVRRSVVPVLAQALKDAKGPQERAALAQALGELGPAACDAVPILTGYLHTAATPSERQTFVLALGRMGPAARPAVPALVSLIDSTSAEDRHNACRALERLGPTVRRVCEKRLAGKAETDPAVRKTIEALAGQDGRIGVNDGEACFSVRCQRDGGKQIRQLAHIAHREILIETVPSLSGDHPTCCDLAEMGARAAHVLIARDPPAVRVHVSQKLRQEGIDPEAVRKQLETVLKTGSFDDTLRAALRALTPGKR